MLGYGKNEMKKLGLENGFVNYAHTDLKLVD